MRREGKQYGAVQTRFIASTTVDVPSVRTRFIASMGVDFPSVRTRFIASCCHAAIGTHRVCPRPMDYSSLRDVATLRAVSVAVV